MLEVQDLHAYYGKSHILQGVDMYIDAGEVVSLLRRNGVGRSTTVKAIMGEVPPQRSMRVKGSDIAGLPSYRIADLGLGYVPEHRDIIPGLPVRQNLMPGINDTRRAGKRRSARNGSRSERVPSRVRNAPNRTTALKPCGQARQRRHGSFRLIASHSAMAPRRRSRPGWPHMACVEAVASIRQMPFAARPRIHWPSQGPAAA